jgi:GNAT superfamily N-acetyltransferase
MSDLRIVELQGEAIRSHLDDLADVRIAVFREWPYLYEGTREYEAKYLEVYLRSPRSYVAMVYDSDRCIGATTAIPLADAGSEAQLPFHDGQLPIGSIDYFGESVLLPAYRGRGLGVKFFELREAHANQYGLTICTFCAVERPPDHPAKPKDYVPNDEFWQRRGYRKMPELRTTFSWPDIGEAQSTAKPMVFWSRTQSC